MRKVAISIMLLCGLVLSASSQLPMDSALRYGVLPNGMTYYIRSNSTPPDRAEFWLVHKVGSVMEEEDERGLAHFLEHLAFTGTKNFSESQFYNYITSNGMAFGTDVNATTGYDDTQYYITNIPTRRQSMLDSMLLIMRDLSCNLTLDSTLIDKERAIIEQERISNSGYQLRLQEHIMPVLMRGSRYAQRIPIGLPEVVSHASRRQLLDFYHRWYRPDRQALIVVGDFDAQTMERKVRRILGVTPAPLAPMPVANLSLPDHKGVRAVCHTDPDANATMANIYFKHDDLPENQRNNEQALRLNMVKSLATYMLARRLEQQARKPGCPWMSVHVEDTHFIATRSKEALAISGMAKAGLAQETLQELLTETRRAQLHGFTDTELAQAKEAISSNLNLYSLQSRQHETGEYVSEYIDHYLSGGYIPGVTREVELSLTAIRQTSLKDVNRYLKQRVTMDNACIFIAGPEQASYPGESDMQKMFHTALACKVTPYSSEAVQTSPLMRQEPRSGRILQQETDTTLQTTTMRLSNGATVMLRPSKLRANAVMLDAIAPGGRWVWDETHAAQLKVLEAAIEDSKLGGHTQEQLQQMLVGKQVSLSFALGDDYHELRGGCSTADLETLLQINYLYFTDVTADDNAFQSLVSRLRSQVKQRRDTPESLLADSAAIAHYGHRRLLTSLTEDELDGITYEHLLTLYQTYIAHPEAYTFILCGDFDIDSVRPLIEKYISGIPTGSQSAELHPSHPIHLKPGNRTTTLVQSSSGERAQIQATLSGIMAQDMENELLMTFYGHLMEIVFNAALREEHHLTYGVSAQGQMLRTEPRWMLTYELTCKPDSTAAALTETQRALRLVKEQGVSQLLFDKVKQMLLRRHAEDLNENAYWMNVLRNRVLGHDIHTGVEERLESLTYNQMCEFIARLNSDTHITVVLKPQS